MRPMFIAELSGNHNGKRENIFELIDAAQHAWADVVKLQVYAPTEMVCNSSLMIESGPWKGQSYYSLYEKNHIPFDWLPDIWQYAKDKNIAIFSSVFGPKSLEALEKVGCGIYKVASCDANDPTLLKLLRQTGKKVYLSTGTTRYLDIVHAAEILADSLHTVMHCMAAYPHNLKEANLGEISYLKSIYKHVGYSDHTLTPYAAMFATILGVTCIEKHIKLDHEESVDDFFSLTSKEYRTMVEMCKYTFDAHRVIDRRPIEADSHRYKRSIFVTKDIAKGEKFTEENIGVFRPNLGVSPDNYYGLQVGLKFAAADLKAGQPLTETDIHYGYFASRT